SLILLVFLFILFVLISGFSLGVQVNQSPSAVIRKEGDEVQMLCTHERRDYRVMLWYQQPPGEKAVKLIGHVEYAQINYEESYKKHFNITGDMSVNTEKNGSLFIVDVKASAFNWRRQGTPWTGHQSVAGPH
uniref:Immunoglobulin V-set domain-containing protein n=1 Tax=Stegastes partitus TaxID=144197 RepID=A0A3B4ZAP0_9TELE